MKAFCLPLVLALLLPGACSGVEASRENALGVPLSVVSTWPRAEVERDLVLTIERTRREPFQPGDGPELRGVLSNRSRDRAYPVVLSGDGSEVGWREPHAWFELAVRNAGEAFHPPPPEEHSRCGNYDSDWQKDVAMLAPGQSLTLPWLSFDFEAELLAATEIRVILHYSYGERAKDPHAVPVSLQSMPAYAIQSAPLVLPVSHPLSVQLTLHGPIPRGPGQALASAISVTATNVSQHTVPFVSAGNGGGLGFELEYAGTDDDGRGPTELDVFSPSIIDDDQQLLPGKSRPMLEAGTTTNEWWELSPQMHVQRIRALLSLDSNDRRLLAVSPWVSVAAGQ